MPEWITARQFHDAHGVSDWRVVANGVAAYFHTGSFAMGVELVGEIGTLADAAGQDPDVDLRHSGVTVRLLADVAHGLSRNHLELAREISHAAAALGLPADPGAVPDSPVASDPVDDPTTDARPREG